MDCEICFRSFNVWKRKPLCAGCAQAVLYGARLNQATALLDREKSHSHAEAIIRPGNDGVLAALSEDADLDALTRSITKNSAEQSRAEQASTELRISNIFDKADELKRQVEQSKERIVARKMELKRRREELAEEKAGLEKHKPRALEPVIATTKKTAQRLERVRHKIVDARLLLCREAATASNFQRHRQVNGRSAYILGGLVVPDLRELNKRTQPSSKTESVGGRSFAEPHEQVSEALGNVARLMSLCAHYLSVRLPAEIILPHEDFPRSVILPDKSSYNGKTVPFPGPAHSRTSSPVASRIMEQNQARPRPLWLDRSLTQLSKDDNKTYGLYLEGATLLAWDLAWLCKTQGIETINTFEDACVLGKNLYQLLLRDRKRPTLDRKESTATGKGDQREPIRLGVFSHASAQNNLAGHDGLTFMKDFKLGLPARLSDKLKTFLLNDMSGAEWDLLEGREWDEDREDEKPVLVGGSKRPQESRYAAMSMMSVAPHDERTDEEEERKRKANGGWMKVRGL